LRSTAKLEVRWHAADALNDISQATEKAVVKP
jgi:hypothetical protein